MNKIKNKDKTKMKNKQFKQKNKVFLNIFLILSVIFVSFIMGILIYKYLIYFLATPGVIVSLILQGIFHTKGSETPFGLPEVIITTYLFWLLIPWILLFRINWGGKYANVGFFLVLAMIIFSGTVIYFSFLSVIESSGMCSNFLCDLYEILTPLSIIIFPLSALMLIIINFKRLK